MRLSGPCCCLVLVLIALGAVPTVFAQDASPSSDHTKIREEETKFYSGAKSYMDDSLPELKKEIQELKGLKPDSSQEQLSNLLLHIGRKINELLRRVPDLTAEERVTQTQWVVGQMQDCKIRASGAIGRVSTDCSQSPDTHRQMNFHYILLSRNTAEESVLEEYRTNGQNQPITSAEKPAFQGFVGSWVVFSQENRSESRFRYLGEQKIGKRKTFVVAFAQIPGAVNVPGMIANGGGNIPILLQGVAWVDQEDLRIIQLRTDILGPLQKVGLQKQTAKILFGPVTISQLNLELWLPKEVDVHVEANGLIFEEQHAYSKFRLYQATSRIIPAS